MIIVFAIIHLHVFSFEFVHFFIILFWYLPYLSSAVTGQFTPILGKKQSTHEQQYKLIKAYCFYARLLAKPRYLANNQIYALELFVLPCFFVLLLQQLRVNSIFIAPSRIAPCLNPLFLPHFTRYKLVKIFLQLQNDEVGAFRNHALVLSLFNYFWLFEEAMY